MAETLVIQSPQTVKGKFKKIRHINYYFQKLNNSANDVTPYGLYLYIESTRTITVKAKGCYLKYGNATYVPDEIVLENLAPGTHAVRFYMYENSGYISIPANSIDGIPLIDTFGKDNLQNSAKFYIDLDESGYKEVWTLFGLLLSASVKPMNHEISGDLANLSKFRIVKVEDRSGVIKFSSDYTEIKEVSNILQEFTLLGLTFPFTFSFDMFTGRKTLKKVDIWGCPNIVASGDISMTLNPETPMESFRVSMPDNKYSDCHFDISRMPTTINGIFTLNIDRHEGVYTSRAYKGYGSIYLLIKSLEATIYDQIITDLANSDWKGSLLTVYTRTSGSDEAVNILVLKGVNVIVSNN